MENDDEISVRLIGHPKPKKPKEHWLSWVFFLLNPAMTSMILSKIIYDWIVRTFKIPRLPKIVGRQLTPEESRARMKEFSRDLFWQELMFVIPTFLFIEGLVFMCKGYAAIPDMFGIALLFAFIYCFAGGGLYD